MLSFAGEACLNLRSLNLMSCIPVAASNTFCRTFKPASMAFSYVPGPTRKLTLPAAAAAVFWPRATQPLTCKTGILRQM